MVIRFAVIIAFAAALGFCGDWSPRLAAEYLDSRQKEWFAWPPANVSGAPCVSCHTGLPYLLVRPALRRALGESGRTTYETGLLDGLRARVSKKDPKELFPGAKGSHAVEALGVESVFSSLLLAAEDARRGRLSAEAEKAFERMWSLQVSSGKTSGAWDWNEYDLDPWETPDSAFYGAALAALATGTAPAGYQTRPEIRENVAAMTAYLRNAETTQPLHNRLILLWASAKLRDVLPAAKRKAIVDEVWRRQNPDGGWSLESLGDFKKHTDAPTSSGSNGYATGLAAFVLQQAGIVRTHADLARALGWLRSRQNGQFGYWESNSMNKRYKPDSMPARFMQDAATGYATLALLEADPAATE